MAPFQFVIETFYMHDVLPNQTLEPEEDKTSRHFRGFEFISYEICVNSPIHSEITMHQRKSQLPLSEALAGSTRVKSNLGTGSLHENIKFIGVVRGE